MNKKKNVLRSLTLISQFGIYMLVPIFICSFVGMYIDKHLGTSFFMIILFFVGAIAGFRNIFILARQFYEDKDQKDDRKTKQNK